MDGQINRQTCSCMNGRTKEQTDRWTDRQTDKCTDRCMGQYINGWTDKHRWAYRVTKDKQTDEWADRQINDLIDRHGGRQTSSFPLTWLIEAGTKLFRRCLPRRLQRSRHQDSCHSRSWQKLLTKLAKLGKLGTHGYLLCHVSRLGLKSTIHLT